MTTNLARRLIALCMVFIFVQTCVADDWPQWLGPNRDSVWRETGIVERFSEDGPPVRWRAQVAGGYAGPAVAAGRVYVMDYVTTGDRAPDPNSRSRLQGQERVLCFSAANGQLLWKHQYDCPYQISFPAGPRCTPTVDGDRVYTLGAEGDLRCLKTDDGSLVWSHNFPRDYQAATPMWGHCGHPLVDGERLFCVVGGEGRIAMAFDKRTGKELWRALSAKEQAYCPPTMIDAGGQRQLVIWHAEAINGLEPETGRVAWSVPLDANYAMGIATPRQLGQYLFAGGIVNKSVLLRLASDQAAPQVLWRGARGKGIGPVMVTPFLEGDYLYGVDGKGELRCVRLATGEQLWTTYAATAPDNRPTHSACAFLVKHGDRFFLPSETGELIIARLTPEKYDEICRVKIIEPTGVAFGRSVWWSHPAFAQQCLFARNDKELVCVSLAAVETRQ